MRATCPDCGAALPQHTQMCQVAPMLAMAEGNGAKKALEAALPRVQAALEAAHARGVAIAAGQVAILREGYAMVRLQDLHTISGFSCEHEIHGGASCDEADEERGGCCNSCWAARWAKRVLEERNVEQGGQADEPGRGDRPRGDDGG